MASRTYVVKTRRGESWLILLIAGFIIAFSKEIFVFGVVFVFALLILKHLESRRQNKQRSKDLRMVNEAAISMEADYQNMLAQQGDPVGVYGKYDAYTMPLTRPIYEEM